MSKTESSHSLLGDGKPVTPSLGSEFGLEELMARMRLELTGGTAGIPQSAVNERDIPGAHGESVEPFTEPDVVPLSIEEVMARVRLEVGRRRAGLPDASVASSKSVRASGDLPRWRPSAARLSAQPTYVLADLLRFFDSDFVDNAFQIILRRPANAHEKMHYLSAMRSGGFGKVEILGNIRFSDEGKQRGVHVDGLLLPYKLHQWRRIPVLGWFITLANTIFRMPKMLAQLEKIEAQSAQESQHVGFVLNELVHAVEVNQALMQAEVDSCAGREEMRAQAVALNRLRDLLGVHGSKLVEVARTDHETREILGLIESKLAAQSDAHAALEVRLQTQLSDQVQTLTAASSHLQEQLQTQASILVELAHADDETRDAFGRMEARIADQSDAHAALEVRLQTQLSPLAKLAGDSAEDRLAVRDIEQRLMAFIDQMNRRVAEASASGTALAQEGETLLDTYYVSFENSFRGSREDIKTRAEHYLETFSEVGIDKNDGLVLDLGCGRGEWLEVLTEHGYACRGVDLNSAMITEALALGLDVVESDAVAYLRSLENESVLAVTSMHLVEHVPHAVLIALLDEAWRVLLPGGVLILETPNPENLTVGSHWFYMDPTHRNPIPPTLLQWVVQARGFESAAIERLTLNRGVTDIQPVDEGSAGSSQINKIVGMLTAAPDYAIVARKRHSSNAHPQENVTG
jgi:SAM-dependent methyltransferase